MTFCYHVRKFELLVFSFNSFLICMATKTLFIFAIWSISMLIIINIFGIIKKLLKFKGNYTYHRNKINGNNITKTDSINENTQSANVFHFYNELFFVYLLKKFKCISSTNFYNIFVDSNSRKYIILLKIWLKFVIRWNFV